MPFTFTRNRRSKSSSVVLSTVPICEIPALFTRISIRSFAKSSLKTCRTCRWSVTSHACDVTDQRQVRQVFKELFAKERIEILVNNAGISHIGTVESTTEEDFDRLFRVNVKGIYNGMLACIGHMKASGGGVVLNMASIAGSAALADRFAYSMTKGAVIAMTYSVAKDYVQHNIRCNCISPARVHTPFV